METKNSRRILDRSREPELKKHRLAEDPTLPLDRTSIGRTTYMQQRPGNSGLASSRRLSERGGDSERSDSVRGLQPQLQNQHLEILSVYKTALGELTFNSKPIITNLTIIAGENLDAAKTIAAIVSSHILEVPSEQKLPSLYLLDSIVKNIGKDYIKYFGFKLPEVFCKAYRQVDPSVHQGMRHLFGTWKGVFPLQPLQAIEKELGFAPIVNKLPSGTTSRVDAPASRPAHSIHVNPKYLEAQQRLQHSSKSNQHNQREGSDVFRAKSITPPFRENEYDFDTQVDEKFTRNVRGTVSTKRNGFDGKLGIQNNPVNKKRPPPNHGLTSQTTIPMSDSWKNDEEEEYTWDGMNTRTDDHDHAANPARDHWSLDDGEKMSEASGDSLSTEMKDQTVFGSRGSSLWSEEPPLTERTRSFAGRTIPGLSESKKVSGDGWSTTYTGNGRLSFQSKVAPATSVGSSVYVSSNSLTSGLTVSVAPQKQAFLGVASPSAQSLLFSRDSSPPTVVPNHDTTQQDEPHARIRAEPRSSQFLGSQNVNPRDKSGKDSMAFPSGNMHPLDQKVQSRDTIPSSLSAKPSQLKHHISASQKLDYEPLASASSRQVLKKPFSRPIASTSSLANDPGPFPSPPSGQSSTNNLLAAVNGILNSHSVALTLPSFPSGPQTPASLPTSQPVESANVTNTNTPFSSLLSSLVAKGLISASNTESTSKTSTIHQPQNHSPDEPSSAKPLSTSSTELSLCSNQDDDIRSHIGFQFKGNVLRVLHPAVINSLFDDFPHKCGVCEGRVKNQDQIDRHLEWHALKKQKSNPKKSSRAWYADFFCMLAAEADNMAIDECTEPMVPADENQCLCILCGEIFEDFYDQQTDQWMFKGAVYGKESIVHDKCIIRQKD